MAERSFKREVQKLRLGDGEVFHGEGILAVTKALLESGVSYVAGYQGAPISHLMDVLTDANEILEELGVHFEHSASEATAAATLAASVHYPLRGAVTFKSTVGTNVASDAAGQPGFGRRHRRRPDHCRRRLRRRLQHHAGTLPRVCHEVADVAARPAAQPALHRARGGAGVRSLGGQQYSRDAGAAHPRVPRARPVPREEQRPPAVHPQGRHGEPGARREPHRAAALQLSARAGKDREALARGAGVHPQARAQRAFRRGRTGLRHHPPGRHVQHHGAGARTARPLRRFRQHRGAALRPERHLSAGGGRGAALLRLETRRAADRRGAARFPRAEPARHPAQGRARYQGARQGPAADGRRVHRRGGDPGHSEIRRGLRAAADRPRAVAGGGPPRGAEAAGVREAANGRSTRGRPRSAPDVPNAPSSPP